MNVVKQGGVDLAAHEKLILCVELALDLSVGRAGEIEVFTDGVKMHGFTGGRRSYPSPSQTFSTLNLAEIEARAIERAMEQAKGDVKVAARLLGIGRTTLWRKLKESKPVLVMRRAA